MRRHAGFTLTELAIVIAIVALLLGGLMMTLSAQNSARQVAETQRTLAQTREAMLGFAAANGRLPCPAAPPTPPPLPPVNTGVEAFVNGGPAPGADRACAYPLNGFVPGAALGLAPTDAQGYLLDAWGNPIRYAVSQWVRTPPVAPASCPPNTTTPDFAKCPAFTTANAMRTLGYDVLVPDLRVCTKAIGATGTACGTGVVGYDTPAVLFSLGPSGMSGPPDCAASVCADELANGDGNRVFVARPPATAASGDFDDIVIWISPSILYNRMIAAGAV